MLNYTSGDCDCSGTWNVTVDYGPLFRLDAIASSPGSVSGTLITVEQQSTVTITVEGFDYYENPVPVFITDTFDNTADSLNVFSEVSDTSSEVYVLNAGMNDVTICADGTGGVNACDQIEISVDGTLAGWFEASAPVSWIVLSAAVVLLLGVILLVIILMRRGDSDDEYDDDLYDDEDDYAPPATPSVQESYSEPEPQEEYSADEDPNYRVDEDGTEWWQDDDGAWWYRDPDMDDWAEWTE